MAHFYQFVDAISATPTVLLDLDDLDPFYVAEGSSVSPPKLRRTTSAGLADGSIETGSSYDDRIVRLVLGVELVAAETQAAAITTLVKILDNRDGAWLKWQSEGMAEPRFYRTKRADVDVIDSILDTQPDRQLNIEIPAHPFGYGLPVTGSATVTNDPTTGTHKMQTVMPTVVGDVMAPLHLSFPTPDAAHRVAWASDAVLGVGRETLVLDDFNRPNSTTSVGNPIIGPAPTVYDGVAGIINHQMYFPTDTAAFSIIAWETGTPNVEVEATLNIFPVAANTAGIMVRTASDENGIFSGNTALYRVSAGVVTLLGAHSTALTHSDRMKVRAEGDVITVFRQVDSEGEWVQVNQQTTAVHNTVTAHGLPVFGTSGDTARFRDIKITSLASTPARSAPYYKSLSAATIDATPPSGYTYTDTADATMVAGTRRRITKSAGFDNDLLIPTDAVMQTWDGLPAGDYRVMVRVGNALGGPSAATLKLLFWNRPPRDGVALTELEAAASLPITGSTGRDWHDLGVVAMPGGAPIADAAFGLDGSPSTALWNVGVYYEGSGTQVVDFDAVVLIPARRPNTLTRHGAVGFDARYTSKTVTLDGVNSRRYAKGVSVNAAGFTTDVAPQDTAGALPVVVPNANNVLTFFATAADASDPRINDDKTLTTLLTWKYFPQWAYERPS